MFVSDVNIQPNRTGLPGIASLESIVGALLTFGLVASVAGIAISAIAWAIGSRSGNPHAAGKGKSGVLVAFGGGVLDRWRHVPRQLLQRPRRPPRMSPLTGISSRRKWATAAALLVVPALIAVVVIVNGHASPTSAGLAGVKGPSTTVVTTPSPSGARSLTAEQGAELQQSISRMRAVTPVGAATSSRYPAMSAEARQQPDLYAAAFVLQLLTQDYRIGRDQLLAWVQSESAQSTEPLVVGLTPVELRGKLALSSVQDGVNGLSPVPTQAAWTQFAGRQGYTTVQIQRVIEPVSWASAVASGQITDPGVTARQVDAEVTLHTTDHGKPSAALYSVALVVNLEGPPVRAGYGFVAAITYNVAAVG